MGVVRALFCDLTRGAAVCAVPDGVLGMPAGDVVYEACANPEHPAGCGWGDE